MNTTMVAVVQAVLVSDLTVSDVDRVSEVVYLCFRLSGGSGACISQLNKVVVTREDLISSCGPLIQFSLLRIEMSFSATISSEVLFSPLSRFAISAVNTSVIVICVNLRSVSLVGSLLSVMVDLIVGSMIFVQVLLSFSVVSVILMIAVVDQCLVSL